jgi:hypothetical protein
MVDGWNAFSKAENFSPPSEYYLGNNGKSISYVMVNGTSQARLSMAFKTKVVQPICGLCLRVLWEKVFPFSPSKRYR